MFKKSKISQILLIDIQLGGFLCLFSTHNGHSFGWLLVAALY